jgi:ABC-type multidrug transport system fused ATPase/permease subunit
MSILRVLHPVAGVIEIGGIDIETMRLAALRKYVGLVRMRPILFKGSMLANLDPAGEFQTGEVLPLLIAVGLVDKGVRSMPEAMKVVIEDVDRISSTVKQLICLCRALLRKPQLLILDEFAANIDGRRIRQIDRFLRTQDHFSVLQLSRTFQHVQVCSVVVVVFLSYFLCTEASIRRVEKRASHEVLTPSETIAALRTRIRDR